MMREILFKAKRMDNGEWVEGFYAKRHGVPMIYENKDCPQSIYEIAPSTICQCTGLTDKNGQKIWENDIMVGHIDDMYPENSTYIRVLWHINGFCTNENNSVDIPPIDEFDQKNFEVCGNVFDNPELLEVENGESR